MVTCWEVKLLKEFAILGILLGILFSPSLLVKFAHHDQYRYFTEDLGDPEFKQHCYNDVQNGMLAIFGRPIAAKLECTVFLNSDSLGDLRFFRLLAVAGLALLAAILSLWLQTAGTNPWYSRLFSASLMILPGGQNAVFMTNLANIFTPFFAVLGGIRAVTAKRPVDFLIAFVLTGLAFFAYSPMIPFFFVPLTLLLVVFPTTKEQLTRSAFRAGCVFLAAGAVFYHFGRKKYLANPEAVPEAYRMELSFAHLPQNIPRFFSSILPMELGTWDVYGEVFLSAALSICLVAVALSSRRNMKRLLIGLNLFLGANILYFLTKAYQIYRVAWPATTILVILGFGFALFSKKVWLQRFALAGTLLGLTMGAFNNWRNVMNSRMEMDLVMNELRKAPEGVTHIHILPPSFDHGLNGLPTIGDEYNRSSTSYSGGSYAELVRVALLELGKNPVVLPSFLSPVELDGLTAITLLARSAEDYQVQSGGKDIGSIRSNRRVKLFPWGIKGDIQEGNTINFYRAGTWTKISGSATDLSGNWKVAAPEKFIYVSMDKPGVTAPPNAHIVNLKGPARN